jgi:plastocyanin
MVVWVRGEGNHSVTEDDNRFDQPASDSWSTFVQSFNTADLYPYHCTLHGNVGGVGMAGTVTVAGTVEEQQELHLPDVSNAPNGSTKEESKR